VTLPDSGMRRFVSRPAAWFGGKDHQHDVVIASRVRLVRNLTGKPFPERSGDTERREVREQIRRAEQRDGFLADGAFWPGEDLTPIERDVLAERHLVSAGWAGAAPGAGVVIDPGQTVSLAINGADHLRFQFLLPGFDLIEAFRLADQLDDRLATGLNVAFDEQLGFLSADPADAGTGLRASLLLHLPALALTGRIDRTVAAAGEQGAVVRPGSAGSAGNASPSGNLFMIANRTTLGSTELELIELVERAARLVIEQELQARSALMGQARIETEDKVWRARSILANARTLTRDEFLNLSSAARLGQALGIGEAPSPGPLNRLLAETGAAHLLLQADRAMEPREIDSTRASLVRREFSEAA
jgi:protein arginine kinase